jgi:hypothetical protein
MVGRADLIKGAGAALLAVAARLFRTASIP